MYRNLQSRMQKEFKSMMDQELLKSERIVIVPQGVNVKTKDSGEVINLCTNDYLGLSSHPRVSNAIKDAVNKPGYGLSSTNSVYGSQNMHTELEKKIADFLGMEDAVFYASTFDANGKIFEPFFSKGDAVISDALNRSSVIDDDQQHTVMRYQYKHNDMEDLGIQLRKAKEDRAKHVVIVTDGVFSMEGTIARLDSICDMAEAYGALIIVDDCHATGFVGKTGRGTPEYCGVTDRVDMITSSLENALGGTSGRFIAGKKEVIELLRQRARSYLFSSTLSSSIVRGILEILNMLSETRALRDKLEQNTMYFREKMTAVGFAITPGNHPIVPIMVYNALAAQKLADLLLKRGVYVVGFFHPVTDQGKARIRVQLSATHERDHLDRAIRAFAEAGREVGALPE